MRVLVTGSAGFLGGHFVERLVRDGHEVRGVDIDDQQNPRDARDVFRYGSNPFDLVIHCAAVEPHRSAIEGSPLAVGAGNLALDAEMFQWAARTRPGRVVYISSSAAYPVDIQTADVYPPGGMSEDAITSARLSAPDAIYGWVKLTGERLAAAYREQGGAVTVLRPFSGYGEDQSPDFPFGAFKDRASQHEDPFVIWGDGHQVRDWIHVDDVVGATLAAVEQEVDGPLNLCTGVGTSMRELADVFAAHAGYRPTFDTRSDKPSGVAYRVGDPTRMHEVYEHQISLEEGVKRAIAAMGGS